MSCPQIWNIEKEKVGRQASEAQQKKRARAREKKTKKTLFVGGTTWNFVAAVRK